MPLYEFYNEELGESYEMMMTIANKEKYLKWYRLCTINI